MGIIYQMILTHVTNQIYIFKYSSSVNNIFTYFIHNGLLKLFYGSVLFVFFLSDNNNELIIIIMMIIIIIFNNNNNNNNNNNGYIYIYIFELIKCFLFRKPIKKEYRIVLCILKFLFKIKVK